MLLLLVLFLSDYNTILKVQHLYIFVSFFNYIIFNYEIVKMINSNKRLIVNLNFEVLCHYWTIGELEVGRCVS